MKVVAIGIVLLLLSISVPSRSLTIDDATVVEGVGDSEENLAKEGDILTLRCSLTLEDNEELHSCTWAHVVSGIEPPEGEELLEVICSGTEQTSGTTCTNQGGSDLLNEYASRLYMDVGASHCGLRIGAGAVPADTGEWRCFVSSDPGSSPQFATLDLFVSNQSQITITDPPNNEIIVYEPEGRIEAECTSIGGRPEPTFHWFAIDDSQQIDIDEFDVSIEVGELLPNVPFIKQRMRWTPCESRPCEGQNYFDLICKVDQGDDYYPVENDTQEASALVFVNWPNASTTPPEATDTTAGTAGTDSSTGSDGVTGTDSPVTTPTDPEVTTASASHTLPIAASVLLATFILNTL